MKNIFGFALAFTMLASPVHAQSLDVVASFSVLGDIVKEVGGDKITLKTLVGPDGDAHTFEPAPADAKALHKADMIFINGLGLEKWMEKLVVASGAKAPVIVASEGVIPRQMSEDGQTVTDPHAWQDPKNGALYVRNVEAALKRADPADAIYFQANAETLLAKLAKLDEWTRQQMSAVPAEKRKVITTHDAFGYFGAAYGVTFLAPEGLSTDAEPSAGALAALTDQIKRENIKALFIENMTDPRLMKTISKETGAEMGGELYSDALSKPEGPAPTYPSMFENNVPKLVAAMQKN
ncbi:MAG TPA: metal ABC transporter substrate-binding protein [Parvibaculum sp.]|jgi:zinc/manganese transport system substrate-binding protein